GAVRENPLAQQAKEGFQVDILTSKKEVYVGEPFVMLLRAYWTKPVRNLNIIQTPNFEGVLQNQLDLQQRERREVVDGKSVIVLDFDKKLLTPTQPGTLGGQELKLSGQVQVPTGRRDFFNMPEVTYINQVATAKIPAVKIKPLPSPKPAGFSGAVGELKLTRELSRTSVSGDESITLKIKISGMGNFNTISVPELVPPQGFDIYDPKFNEKINYTTSGVSGYKELEYLLVPQFKGDFIVPEMRWTYFNTKTGTYEELVLDEETVEVLSGAEAPAGADVNGAVVKREVQDIDSDIRYLHPIEEPRGKRNGILIAGLLAAVVAGLWGMQGIRFGGKAPSKLAVWQREKKKVMAAFSSGADNRYGILFNTLEAQLLSQGLDKEHIKLATLQQTFGEERGAQLHGLLERCQMAEYAPGAVGDDQWFMDEFKTVWEWM
ncbi:MAG: protein BatD, partial [Flavobacteriia bacterium]|nr:protein BatD [Flavobacteriia bacterium]